MRNVLTPSQMRDFERRYMDQTATASIDLMERAAQGVVRAMQAIDGASERLAIFACGPGGNGGDGLAAARIYAERFGKAIVLAAFDADKLSGDVLTNYERARATKGVAFAALSNLVQLPTPAIWVDALFGIGLTRPLDPSLWPLIDRMAEDRTLGARVLAVDIASGLDAATGRVLGRAVAATDTVTFECLKCGHLLEDGIEMSGDIQTMPLGIPVGLMPPDPLLHVTMDDVHRYLTPRARNSHKGSYGHLLIVAGSCGMAGAAALAAGAALRSGVGLVTIACPRSIVPILQVLAPCAMCAPMEEDGGVISRDALPALVRALKGKSAVAIGPGLSTQLPDDILRCVLTCELPAVIDADALNLLSARPDLQKLLRPHHLLTPHPGEARRLLGRDIASPIDAAHALCALGAVALYKGAASVIAGQYTFIRTDGCSGMATGGSGDVLTGILGALMAQGYEAEGAAWMGAVAHGVAGERAADRSSEMGMTAFDMLDSLASVWRDVR